jgi:hypothetical protein
MSANWLFSPGAFLLNLTQDQVPIHTVSYVSDIGKKGEKFPWPATEGLSRDHYIEDHCRI